MAPELVSNYIAKSAGLPSNSFDGMACDMWALGVMLIQLLTGSLPFWPKTGFDYHSMQALLNKWVSRLLCLRKLLYLLVAVGIVKTAFSPTVAFAVLDACTCPHVVLPHFDSVLPVTCP